MFGKVARKPAASSSLPSFSRTVADVRADETSANRRLLPRDGGPVDRLLDRDGPGRGSWAGRDRPAAGRGDPDHHPSAAALADFQAEQRAFDVGRRQRAVQLFQSAIEKDPDFAYAYLNAANSASSARGFKDNLECAAERLEGKSEGARLLVEIAQTFLDNDAEKRIRLCEALVETYPASPRAWLTFGFMQGGLDRVEAARESFDRAVELDSGFLAVHYALWLSYLFDEPKDFERAGRAMERSI